MGDAVMHLMDAENALIAAADAVAEAEMNAVDPTPAQCEEARRLFQELHVRAAETGELAKAAGRIGDGD